MKIERGRVVKMHYRLRDESGETLEASDEKTPLSYLHGYGNLVPGLEKALEGCDAGLKTTVTIGPADAYGERDEAAVIRAPREEFPEDLDLTPGAEVQAETPDGPITFKVVSADAKEAVLDANHPLAGRTLTFDVEVVDVRLASKDEIAHGHAHGGHHSHGHE